MARHNQPQGDNQWQNYKGIHESNEIMLSQQLATDVTFNLPVVTGGGETKSIGAHKYMLISRSPVFWSMFCGDIKESDKVDIKDVEFNVFKEMLNYIYTEKVNLTGDNVMLVLHASKKYIIGSLTEKCTEYLESKLDTSNVCQIFEQCQLFNESELVTKCFEIIQYDTDLVMKSDGFKQISKTTLNQILDAKKLSIPEVQVFEACLSWAGYQNQGCSNPVVIRNTLGETLYKIHIPTMSNEELGSVISPSAILTEKEELMCYRFVSKSKLPFDLPFPREHREVSNKNILLSRDTSSVCQIYLENSHVLSGQLKNVSACSLEVIELQLIHIKSYAVNIIITQLEKTQSNVHVHGQILPPKILVSRTISKFDDIKQSGGCTVAEIKLDNSFVLDSQDTVTYKVVFTPHNNTIVLNNACFVNGETCVFTNKEKQIIAKNQQELTPQTSGLFGSQNGNLFGQTANSGLFGSPNGSLFAQTATTTLQNPIPFTGITCKCSRGK